MRTARRNARPGLIAVVIILWVMIATIAITGTLIAAFAKEHPARFSSPLKIYPITQQIPGPQCPPGVRGVVGPGGAGQVCYQLTTGITIRRVNDIHVERATGGGGYAVSLTLIPPDGKALRRLTGGSPGRFFALTVRDQIVTAPRVDAPITKGRVLITGNLTRTDANALVNRLKGRPAPQTA
jgi:hypothetical protein